MGAGQSADASSLRAELEKVQAKTQVGTETLCHSGSQSQARFHALAQNRDPAPLPFIALSVLSIPSLTPSLTLDALDPLPHPKPDPFPDS